MATISIPAATHINVVATTFDHSAKSNLGEIRTGSYLSQASMLVYDDILRFQNSTDAPTADVSNFNYNEFEGNILWFMDELVGMESDWIKTASASSTTAYGYVQFTEDSVETAVNRYIGHLERFNERSLTRDWVPYSIKLGETLPIPEWLTTLKNSTKTHEEKLDALTYDEMLALAFVHLHSKKSKDSNFVLLAEGDIYASKEIYKNNHHTSPDAATLTRLEDFFPWRKQNKYVEKLAHATSSVPSNAWMHKHCADNLNQGKTPDDVIACISAKLIMHSGDDLKIDYENEANNNSNNTATTNIITITDVTPSIAANLGVYAKYNSLLTNQLLEANSQYKVFLRKDSDDINDFSFYFYRSGDIATEWLQNIKVELNNHPDDYNYDELCQTINSWSHPVHTYIIDWQYNASNANYIIPPATPLSNPLRAGFYWPNYDVQSTGIMVVSKAMGDTRSQLGTMFHEGGGHAIHVNRWGGEYGAASGDNILLDNAQNDNLLALYGDYKTIQDQRIAVLVSDYYNKVAIRDASQLVYNASLLVWQSAKNAQNTTQVNLDGQQLNLDIRSAANAYQKYLVFHNRVYGDLPMANIRNIGLYTVDTIEEEFIARIYQTMATNRCITFVDDIWPVMKAASPAYGNMPSLADIIDLDMAEKIDIVMRDEMKLDHRSYNIR